MLLLETIKVCEDNQLNLIYSWILSKKNKEQICLKKALFERAYNLYAYNFLSEKLEQYFYLLEEIGKNENRLLSIYFYSNLKTNNHKKNIDYWNSKKDKIIFEYKRRFELLNLVAYSFWLNNDLEECIYIWKEIKEYHDEYKENFIHALGEKKMCSEAIEELKKYHPQFPKNIIWKEMNLANMYCDLNDIKKLKKQKLKAEKMFRIHRLTKENIAVSTYFYYLGKFSEKLEKLSDAVHFYKESINHEPQLITDQIYKDKAKDRLLKMGVTI